MVFRAAESVVFKDFRDFRVAESIVFKDFRGFRVDPSKSGFMRWWLSPLRAC